MKKEKTIMKERKKRRGFKKVITGVIAVALAAALGVSLMPSNVQAAKVSDANTSTVDYYGASLGDEYSTEYAGRIWTDKSVDTTSLTYGEQTISLSEDSAEEFLVTFSALATSQTITGQSTAPVDVVFVIDTSGSMNTTMNNRQNRLYNAVQALNESVTELLAMNPNNRIGVVAFNSTSYELLPLDSYTQSGTTPFFSCRNTTITINAVDSDGDLISKTHTSSNGTNIQKGIFSGMNMLATETETTVTVEGTTYNRMPAVIILSDGQPSNASSYQSWWNVGSDTNRMTPNGTLAVYGMKAIMTGAYMKEAIDVNYGLVSSVNKTTVYTIGVGISDLGGDDEELAYATLDPENHLNDNNTMTNSLKNAWNTYLSNNYTGTPRLNNYTFNHPSGTTLVNGVVDIGRATAADTTIDFEDIYYADDYYDADTASAVTEVFANIVSNISISAAEVPTEIKGTNPATDGYITYTDPIGTYMEVKNVKALVYNDQVFTQLSSSTTGNVTTYTFANGTVDTGVYEDQSISNIIIQVTQVDEDNQTMVIKVPAALVPVRVNSVVLGSAGTVSSHEHNGMTPVRVIYSVGLQDGIVKDGIVQTSELSAEYVAANKDSNGNINFYSNIYTGAEKQVTHIDGSAGTTTVGDTTVTFEPAHTNPFYYIQDGYVLYDEEGDYVLASALDANGELDPDATYHYYETYYHGTEIQNKEIVRTGAQLNRTNLVVGTDGYVYREAGSPRLNKIMLFEGTKADKGASTGTAEDFYLPTFEYGGANKDDALSGYYKVYLGNNGLLSLPASGSLEITKNVVIPTGLTGPGDISYEFTVDFNGDTTVEDAYEYVILNADGTFASTGINTIADLGKIYLKDGQKAVIKDLPHGMTYTVTETAVDGFTTTKTGDAGTIAAGETDTAVFTNTYEATSVIVDSEAGFQGAKVLSGKDWSDTDSFTFIFESRRLDTPMPAAVEGVSELRVIEGSHRALFVTVADKDAESGEAVKIAFGNIEYTLPGVYEYVVSELIPTDEIHGVSYSAARYTITVTVEDNGTGQLEAALVMTQALDDMGSAVDEVVAVPEGADGPTATFTNVFDAESEIWTPAGTKVYTDNSGANVITNNMFQFKIEALTTGAPMPDEAIVGNVDSQIGYGAITFTKDDAGVSKAEAKEYRYKFTEVIPEGAMEVEGSGIWYYQGMYYDGRSYEVTVLAYLENGEVVLDVIYPPYSQPFPDTTPSRVVFFNTYDPADTTAEISGTKTLEGRDMKDGETFEFVLNGVNDAAKEFLTDAEGNTVVPKAYVSGGKDGEAVAFSFETLTFDKPGVYEFTVTETAGMAGGVDYTDHAAKVTVTVTDTEGVLSASVSYDEAADTDFVNTYTTTFDESTFTNLQATKNLTGRTINNGEFFIMVEPQDGAPMSRAVAVPVPGGDGVYTSTVTILDNVVFTEAGTYTYLISEQIPTGAALVDGKYVLDGVTYDSGVYRYTIVVSDVEQNGILTVTSTKLEQKVVAEDGTVSWTDAAAVVFDNEYTTETATYNSPVLEKVLEGYRNTPLKDGEFTFEMYVVSENPAGGVTLPDPATATNDAEGKIKFDDVITFTKAGDYVLAIREVIPSDEDKDDTITYSDNVLTAAFKVTDDGKGKLHARAISITGSYSFTNTYTTTGTLNVDIHKTLDGRDWNEDDAFTFEVVITDQITQDAIDAGDIVFPVTNDKIDQVVITDETADHIAASPTLTINKPGTYHFEVREIAGSLPALHYDGTARSVIVTAEDNGDGTMDVSYTVDGKTYKDDGQTLEFVNVYDPTSTELSGHDDLRIIKEFTGREDNVWYEGEVRDSFTFILESLTEGATTGDNPAVVMPDRVLLIDNTNRLYAHFGNIEFHKAGVYEFKVSESIPTGAVLVDGKYVLNGIIYDDAYYIVRVSVVDNQSILSISEVTYTKVDGDVQTAANAIEFQNTYSVEEVELSGAANLKVTKVLEGRDWTAEDVFTFTLEAADEDTIAAVNAQEPTVILPENAGGITVTAAKNGVENFGNIIFKEAGTYKFVIKEVDSGLKGMSYDKHEAEITVTVTDDSNGNLIAAAPTDMTSLTFTNVYTPDPVPVVLKGTKALEGRTMNSSDVFDFQIVALTEGAPLPASTTVSNDAEGVISFGAIQFTKEGTYEYEIRELAGNIPGVAYDTTPVQVKVVVTNKDNGSYAADVTYTKGGQNLGETFVFTNTYTTSQSDAITIAATKKVTPSTGNTFQMEAGDFSFEIIPAESNPDDDPINQKVVTNDADGAVVFGSGSYKQAGTYVYTVHETGSKKAGIILDDSVYTVTVKVSDNAANAKLEANVTITKNGSNVDAIAFNNGYDPAEATVIMHGQKNLLGGHRDLKADEFTFQLAATTEGAPMPADGGATAKNDEAGLFQFGTITFTGVGTYTYEITEKAGNAAGVSYDRSAYKVTVVVTDENGELKAEVSGLTNSDGTPAAVFNNTYVPGSASTDLIGGTKNLEGRPLNDGEFEFALIDKDGEEVAAAKNVGDKFSFDDITFDKAGEYSFTIVEKDTELIGVTYDFDTVYGVTVSVEDKGGKLAVTDITYMKDDADTSNVVFNNSYAAENEAVIQIGAAKTLSGRALLDGEFTFTLIGEDGTNLTAVNKADGSVLFDEITYTDIGTYVYTVTEEKGNLEDVTYDESVYTVTVEVTDDFKGSYVAEVTDITVVRSGETESADAVTFINNYDAPDPDPEPDSDPEEKPGESPKTGDYSSMWMLLAMIGAAGAFGTARYRRR